MLLRNLFIYSEIAFCLCPIVEVCTPQAFGVNIPKTVLSNGNNDAFMRFFGYDRFSSASNMFVENRVGDFKTRMRRLMYGFHERQNTSRNSLVI